MSRGDGTRRGWTTLMLTGWAIVTAACCVPGCGVEFHEEVGPRVPVPNVEGVILRDDAPADDLEIELRAIPGATVVDSATTASDGEFWFADVVPGEWEIKVSGDETEDFDSITLEFELDAADAPLTLPALDIHAHGAAPVEPADGDTRPVPNPFQPLLFRWLLPARVTDWARVQLYDVDSDRVWDSSKALVDSVQWNGIGNVGDYAGELVPAGSYAWRVKFGFPDSVEARLDWRDLVIE